MTNERRHSYQESKKDASFDEELKVTRQNIKFTMFYDKGEERFYVSETAYELQKLYVVEYDENRMKI
jgi:hypothetical protein